MSRVGKMLIAVPKGVDVAISADQITVKGANGSLSRPLSPLVAVKNIRGVRKQHMIHNDLCPQMEIDPETYEVRANGELLVCEPAKSLPMAQRYFLF